MSIVNDLERDDDRPAYVRFERRSVPDKEATLAAGHHVAKDEDYVVITPPYSKDAIPMKVSAWLTKIDANLKAGRANLKHVEYHKQCYKNWIEGQEPPLDGTSVKEWNALSPAQCANLISAGCKTIEDLAQANDEALRRIGMGANDLKNKAKAWLQAAKDHGPLTDQVTQLQNENGQLKGSIKSLQEQIRLMQIQLDAKACEPVTEHTNIREVPPVVYETPTEELSPTEQYIKKFGKKPHHLMKDENILKKLQE